MHGKDDELKQKIAELEGSASVADEERRELLLRRAEYQRASASLEQELRAAERANKRAVRSAHRPWREFGRKQADQAVVCGW